MFCPNCGAVRTCCICKRVEPEKELNVMTGEYEPKTSMLPKKKRLTRAERDALRIELAKQTSLPVYADKETEEWLSVPTVLDPAKINESDLEAIAEGSKE